MPSIAITRRRLLATGINATAALTLGSFLASAEVPAGDVAEALTFYDPRFPDSRQLAGAMPRVSRLVAVQGDPSQCLALIAPVGQLRIGLRLQGVTTETIPFCLEQLVRRHHQVRFASRRLDRDLFVWSLASCPP